MPPPYHSTHLLCSSRSRQGSGDRPNRERLASPQTVLLSLTGPAGTGKTRSASRLQDDSRNIRGAIWFVPLADVSDPSLISQRFACHEHIPLDWQPGTLDRLVMALQTGLLCCC